MGRTAGGRDRRRLYLALGGLFGIFLAWILAIFRGLESYFWADTKLIMWSWAYSAPLTVGIGILVGIFFVRRLNEHFSSTVMFWGAVMYIFLSAIPHLILEPLYKRYPTHHAEVEVTVKRLQLPLTLRNAPLECTLKSIRKADAMLALVDYQGIERRLCVDRQHASGEQFKVIGLRNAFGFWIEDYYRMK